MTKCDLLQVYKFNTLKKINLTYHINKLGKKIKTHNNSKHVHVQLFQFSQNSTCTCETPRSWGGLWGEGWGSGNISWKK